MRTLLGILVTLALMGLLFLTGARLVDWDWKPTILLASFSSYALLGYAVALVLCALLVRGARRRWLPVLGVLVAAVGIAAHAWWWAPQLTATDRAGGADLTVMSANLQFGRGDTVEVVRTVAESSVDVIVLQEVTASAEARLERAGLAALLPYRAGRPAEDASGTMVWSSYPLTDARPLALGNGGLDVRVGTSEPFRLLAVHTSMPLASSDGWSRDLRTLQVRAAASVKEGPTLLAGDFNATFDHAQLRKVLDVGLRDAAEQSGGGWQPTWPTRYRRDWLSPLIAIDHVLAGESYVASRTRTVEITDTDHLALLADLEQR